MFASKAKALPKQQHVYGIYMPGGAVIANTPGKTGFQFSLLGIVGCALGKCEGMEISLLGLTLKLDLFDGHIEMPGLGNII